jgi:hypothetical protein
MHVPWCVPGCGGRDSQPVARLNPCLPRPGSIGWRMARQMPGPFNGFRRYHAGCNHCHGPDGVGSMFSPSLVERLPGIDEFRRIVLHGQKGSAAAMRGFADDPNFAPYVDDIYAYLQARADGTLGRGRPEKLQP